MKRLILGVALSLMGGCAMAQNSAFYKAQDKMNKGELAEAESLLEAALENPKTTAFAKLYNLGGQIEQRIFNPELIKAAQGLPFDTVAFCEHFDKSVNYFTKSYEANMAPNEKGKVNIDKDIQAANKLAISQMLDYYNYAAIFMNQSGRTDESIRYFQLYADMPKNVVFTAAETDSIYASKAEAYSQVRFNLAFLYYQKKDWDNLIPACDAALNDTIGTHDIYVMKLQALQEKGDTVEWEKVLGEAVQRTGASNFQQTLLYHYMQHEKVAEADALAQTLVTNAPDDKNSWYMKGAIELNVKKDYPASRESFEKALSIDPDFEDALFNMGIAYINDIYEQRNSGKFQYIGTNRRIEGKTEAAYAKEKAIYDAELATVKSYYENARPYLEHLRELTPDQPRRWASALQMVYSSLEMKDKAQEMDDLLDAANAAALGN